MRTKKTKLLYLFVFSFLFLIFPNTSFAQDSSTGSSGIANPAIMPIKPPSNPNFLGQSHYYSITFRGNGEAVVSSKIIFSNLDTTNLISQMNLGFGKINPTDLTVYQVLQDPQCIRYSQLPSGTLYVQPTCLTYADPDYYQFWGNYKYQKADFKLVGDTLTVNLPNPVKPNASGAFFVYFRSNGYTNKNTFSAYPFIFETLKVTDKIQSIQVGISTDSDLYLKGATGSVNYRVNEAVASLKSAVATAPSAVPGFDNFYNQIGTGTITKNASALSPSETYKVSGIYADSQIKLYVREILTGLSVFVGVIIGVSLIGFVVYKLLKNKTFERTNKIIVIFVVSLATSILASLYTGLIIAGFNYISNSVYFYSISISTISPLIALLVGVISLIVYGILIFGGAVFIYSKYGIGASIATLFLTLIFVTLFLGVGILILILFSQQKAPIVYPMMKGASGTSVESVPPTLIK